MRVKERPPSNALYPYLLSEIKARLRPFGLGIIPYNVAGTSWAFIDLLISPIGIENTCLSEDNKAGQLNESCGMPDSQLPISCHTTCTSRRKMAEPLSRPILTARLEPFPKINFQERLWRRGPSTRLRSRTPKTLPSEIVFRHLPTTHAVMPRSGSSSIKLKTPIGSFSLTYSCPVHLSTKEIMLPSDKETFTLIWSFSRTSLNGLSTRGSLTETSVESRLFSSSITVV